MFEPNTWLKVSYKTKTDDKGLFPGEQYNDGHPRIKDFVVTVANEPNDDPLGTIRNTVRYGPVVKMEFVSGMVKWKTIKYRMTSVDYLDEEFCLNKEIPEEELGEVLFRPEW